MSETATLGAVFGLSGLPELRPSEAENLAGMDTGREHLSHSQVSTLLTCPQKYAFEYEEKIEPIARREALSMGKAFQYGIEMEDPQEAYDSLYDEWVVFSPEDEADREIKSRTVRAAAKLYLDTYPDEAGAREYEYRVRLRNPWTGAYSRTFDLLGYADEVIDNGGTLTLIENKLVGQITALNVRRLPLDRQISLACYGLWRATGLQVEKVIYRWTRKPSIKPRKGETPGEFCERMELDYITRPDFYAVQETTYRSSADMARTEAELWEWAEQIRTGRKRKLWPRSTSRCGDFGGCPFIPICAGDPDAHTLYQSKSRNERNTNGR